MKSLIFFVLFLFTFVNGQDCANTGNDAIKHASGLTFLLSDDITGSFQITWNDVKDSQWDIILYQYNPDSDFDVVYYREDNYKVKLAGMTTETFQFDFYDTPYLSLKTGEVIYKFKYLLEANNIPYEDYNHPIDCEDLQNEYMEYSIKQFHKKPDVIISYDITNSLSSGTAYKGVENVLSLDLNIKNLSILFQNNTLKYKREVDNDYEYYLSEGSLIGSDDLGIIDENKNIDDNLSFCTLLESTAFLK